MARKPTYEELEQRIRELGGETVRRERAEEALRIALTKYRTLFDAFPMGITVSDEAGKILETNLIAEKLLGVPQDEQTQRDIDGSEWCIVRPDGTPMPTEEYASVRALKEKRQVENVEMGIVKPDGEITWISATAAPLPLEGHGVVITYGDITESKRAEQALRESERMLRSIVEHSNELFYVHDKGHRLTYVSPRCKDILGYTPEELAMKWTELATENPVNLKGIAITEKAIETGEKQDPYFLELRRKDGTPVLLEIDESPIKNAQGKILGITGAARDVTEHQRDEEALRESEERYRIAIEGSNDGIAIVKNFAHVYMNQRFVHMFGYERLEELEGKPHYFNVHPDDLERVKNYALMRAKGQDVPAQYGFKGIRKDGTSIDVEVSVNMILYQGERAILAFLRDITERKRAEEALRRSQQLFSTIFRANPAAVILSSLADGKCVDANEAYARLTGYAREELIGKTTVELNIWLSSEERQRVVAELAEKGHMENVELTLRRKNGERINTIAGGEVITMENQRYILSFFFDITERRRMEAALRSSEERYRNILESIEEGYYEVDLAGNVTFFNDSVCKLLGYSKDELMGMNSRQYTDAQSAKTLYRVYNEVYRTGRPTKGFDWEVIRKDRTKRFVEASVTLMKDAEGKPLGFRGIARDVTNRKQAEEEKQRLETQLQQAQKMEAIGTLAGGLAHDFNNILMGIQGRASLMLMDMDSSNPHFEHLRGIEEYVRSAADLTRQLLGFARGGKYEVKPTDVNDLVERSATLFGRTKKEISIHRKFQPALWTAEVDQRQIEQVLLNLFVNAWQAMPAGGELYLQTENVVLDEGDVKPHGVKPGPYAKISVTDTGVGMDEQTKQRLFDPFFTTKGMGRGTGLGLASAYGIIKNHEGIITVYSEKGHGTTFNIYLPASAKEVSVEKESTEDLLKGEGTLLLVDDEEMILEVGKPMLERLGYEVLVARSGKEAIEVYQGNRDRIRMVILDMVMPQMSGGETFDQLKVTNPHVKILLSSGYSINGQAQEILARGCDGFIQKPFTYGDLSRKLKEVLDRR